jgi:hypothetical protein
MSDGYYGAVEYKPTTGEIVRSAYGALSAEAALLIYDGSDQGVVSLEQGFNYDATSRTHYIDLTDPENPTPTERPASPVTRTDLTLFDVPNGATLWINGVSYPAEGDAELQFTLPGAYSLRVECFPFLDWTDEVVIP